MSDTSQPVLAAILLISCPDRRGIVAAVTNFIFQHEGNILSLDQHVDAQNKVFFMRVAWDLAGFALKKRDEISRTFGEMAVGFEMDWALHFSDEVPRMAIFVSKGSHCLYDILSRYQSGEWRVQIPLIVSNHPTLEYLAQKFDIPFHLFPVTQDTKAEQEHRQLELLAAHEVDFVVLARYMQILSADFITFFPGQIINIHHSFLPAFVGAKPYHQAHDRGVKIIGATSHFVTAELDAGPIIEQDVTRVSHKESAEDFVRKGKDMEKLVLARAISHRLNNRILIYKNKTVVFD